MATKFNTITKKYHAAYAGMAGVDVYNDPEADEKVEAFTEVRDSAIERIIERRSKSVRQIAAKVVIAQNELKLENSEVAERVLESAIADLAIEVPLDL